MFGIFTSEENGELVLIFDIRSSSVGGALVRIKKSSIPTIVFSLREPIIQDETVNINQFLFSALKPLDVIANTIFRAGMGVPTKIFCVLSSPWYVSQTRIINIRKDKPFVFSLALAEDLIKKEVQFFKEEHMSQHPKTKHEIRLIELTDIKTRLNGYKVQVPLDQKVEEVEMTLFISMSPGQVLSGIEEVIGKYFHHKTIKFSTFMMSSFAVAHNMHLDQEDFLLIDAGGEMTDISMIKKNVLCESISFPLGHNHILRGIATALSCTQNEAESYMFLLRDGHAGDPTEKKLLPIVEQLKKEWLVQFQESLANLSKDISIPYVVYLSADDNFMDFFVQVIKSEQFNQYTLTESKFQITPLDTEALHGLVEFGKDTVRDPYIVIDSVYINHFLVYPAKAGII